MTVSPLDNVVNRRGVLQGMGVGALGLAGAALLGCGTKKGASSTSSAPSTSQAAKGGAPSTGAWLPLVAPVNSGKMHDGGTFVTGATATYVQHDPGTALAGNIWHIIGEKGLEIDPQTDAIRPHVFTSWEVADPSGTTLVFKMNPHLFIHNMPPWNGRQFTADDAAWNLERIGGLYADRLKIPLSSFQRASMVANITKAQAVDPLTVKVTLSKPNSSFFKGLMDTRVPFAPKEMDDIGWTDPMKMGGIGPYQVSQWVNGQKMNFNKNPRYTEFRAGEPHFDAANFTVIPDRSSIVAAFIAGQTQILSGLVPIEVQTIQKAKPDALLYSWIDSNWNHFRPSLAYQPFQDFRVRKAISLAIDRNALSDGFYGPGWGYQASLCPGYPEAWRPEKVKTLPGYDPDTKAQDQQTAVQMLAAAGYPNGKGLDWDIIYTNTSGSVAIDDSTRFISQMKTLLPDVKIVQSPLPADGAAFATRQAAGDFKMVAYTITASPDAGIEVLSQYYTNGSRNYGRFTNPDTDALINKVQAELNNDTRTQLLDQFQQRFEDTWMPMYVLRANPARNYLQGNIGGYDTTAGTWYGYSAQTKICRWFYVDK